MTQPKSLALTAGWTDTPVTLLNSGNMGVLGNAVSSTLTTTVHDTITWTNGYSFNGYWYPYYRPYWESNQRPVRLTMSEVERLRVAAKKDKALKSVLEKFTDHIEVIVDFGKP